jgi:ubiquitin C-terminal hydrolase
MHHTGRWAKWGHDISFVRFGEKWIKFNDSVAEEIGHIWRSVTFGEQYLYLWQRVDSL